MTKVKICGITNLEDALDAINFGADALGFNFYVKSPRYVRAEAARRIADRMPGDVLRAGVFVNEALETIIETSRAASLTAIQLHGDETPQFVRDLRHRTDLTIFKALRVTQGFRAENALQYDVNAILLDSYSRDEFGGTGETFDWGMAKQVGQLVGCLYLAGGLSPENVGKAVGDVRPYAVDACSRLESAPGKKDPAKVERFIAAVRETI